MRAVMLDLRRNADRVSAAVCSGAQSGGVHLGLSETSRASTLAIAIVMDSLRTSNPTNEVIGLSMVCLQTVAPMRPFRRLRRWLGTSPRCAIHDSGGRALCPAISGSASRLARFTWRA